MSGDRIIARGEGPRPESARVGPQRQSDTRMKTSTTHFDDLTVVTVSGIVDSRGAGRLYDVLVDAAKRGGTLVVDIAGMTRLTRAGVRGFIVAARLARGWRREMWIRNASSETEEVLSGLGFSSLLRFERDTRAGVSPGRAEPFVVPPPRRGLRPFLVERSGEGQWRTRRSPRSRDARTMTADRGPSRHGDEMPTYSSHRHALSISFVHRTGGGADGAGTPS